MRDFGNWSHETHRAASGYSCPSPVIYQYQSEARQRACGHCARCIAKKKRDVAGRCAAEAYSAAEVVVWTLTYRDGEPGAVDFVANDRQKFMKRLRDELVRDARKRLGAPKYFRGASDHVKLYWFRRISEVLPVVRFMGCGERGKRYSQRCHWHVVLFFSKPSGTVPSLRFERGETDLAALAHDARFLDPVTGRCILNSRYGQNRMMMETRALWPHGGVTVDVLPADTERRMKAVRYCVAYLDKSRSPRVGGLRCPGKAEARFFRSQATPLGFEYLTEDARRHAQAALPVRGDYCVAGVRFSRGRNGGDGDLVRHMLTGRMRDHYIAAYREEWAKRWPDTSVPVTDWLLRFDGETEDRALSRLEKRTTGWRKRGPVVQPLPVVERRDRSGTLMVDVPGKGCVGMVRLRWSGFAEFLAIDGKDAGGKDRITVWPVPHGNIRDYVKMDNAAHERVESWIKDKRGPDWVSARELRIMRYQRQLAQRDAVMRFAKDGPSIEPPHVENPLRPLTALRRKLLINGLAYVPGTVVSDPKGKTTAGFVRPRTGLRKPIKLREP